MKLTAVYALRKARVGGAFLVTHQHELAVLDTLPLWVLALFNALIRASDFKTGRGGIAYAELAARLTPIQPRSGPRHFVPDVQAIKKAVRILESRFIVARFKKQSEADQTLFFELAPRYVEVRPPSELEPQTRTPLLPAKNGRTRTPNSNPSSTMNSFIQKEGPVDAVDNRDVGFEAAPKGREKWLEAAPKIRAQIAARNGVKSPKK